MSKFCDKERISEFFSNFGVKITPKIMKFTPRNVVRFYVEGFRSMTLGRTLWAIILIKLFIMFAILKIFFFPDLLSGLNAEQKADHVMEQLTPTLQDQR